MSRFVWRKVKRPSGIQGVCWECNDSVELFLSGRHLATVSKCKDAGWYWYSMCDELRVNTLILHPVPEFKTITDAKNDCKQKIKDALSK